MTREDYVCAFLFDDQCTEVMLILKKRPTWQAGKFNGIGGQVREDETHRQALRREFAEETGVTDSKGWYMFARVKYGNTGAHVSYFALADSDVFRRAETQTDEQLVPLELDKIDRVDGLLPDLRWLIPMAVYQVSSEGRDIHAEIDEWRRS